MTPSDSSSDLSDPAVAPPPRSDQLLDRVRALLAKAERTEFPDEADALMAKAQELMARHSISDAMIRSRDRGTTAEAVTSRRFTVDAPYASAKRTLLGSVAAANSCRTVFLGDGAGGSKTCQVFGHPSDLTMVETLYTSLSVQATRAMLAAPVPPGDTARRFRHAFLLAFAPRVGHRLHEASRAARAEAEAEAQSGDSVSVVLAGRDAAVDRALRQEFPRTRSTRSTATSGAGWQSGRRAADMAGLGQRGIGQHQRSIGAG